MQRASLSRLDSLTGLRFFAAWMVLVHHFANFAGLPGLWRYQGFGATGVTFFFVLSGFVLTWSFVPGDTPPRFYWRRFARIWPLHAVTTVLALPVFYSMRDVPYDWTAIGLSFLLLHAWVPTVTTYFAGNPASWTLSCEMFFYALHPFIVRPSLALRPPVLAVATAAVLALVFSVARWSPDWFSLRIVGWLLYVSPLFRVGEFVLGIGLAAALKRGFRVRLGVIPAALLVAAWFHVHYQLSADFPAELQKLTSQATYVVLPVLYAALIAAAAQLDVDGARSWLRAKPLVLLGQWSYALYLVHATIIYALIDSIGVRGNSDWNVLWLLGVSSVSIAVSAGLYYVVEHPIEQRLRAWQRLRTVAVASEAVEQT
ncbi:MAG: acyltransferase [Dehalococcoidia bacterium]|nr:acyltransferase [Dehalococcoidia bacterium]